MVLSGRWCSRTWRWFSCLAGGSYGLVVFGLGIGWDGSGRRGFWWVVGSLGGMGYLFKLGCEISLERWGVVSASNGN